MTQESDHKNTEIIEILKQHPDGLSRGEISNKLSFGIENKTLYRKLSQLVKANLIRKTGDRRATKYFHLETGKDSYKDISHPIFSKSSMKALKYLDNPAHSRPVMSYNRKRLTNDTLPQRTAGLHCSYSSLRGATRWISAAKLH